MSAVVALEAALETLRTAQKLEMFDRCVQEIEMLIYVSVLSQFYESDEFNRIALRRRPKSVDGDVVPQQHRSKKSQSQHAMSIRGYAKRMPSLYDAVSKTEEKSAASPALTVTKAADEQNMLSLDGDGDNLGVRMSPISTDHDPGDLTLPQPLVLSPMNTANGIRPYHRKVARSKTANNNSPPILVVECIFKFIETR